MAELDFVRVFAHSNALLVSHIHNVLTAAGVPAELRNLTLGGGAGELPLSECEPEVWVAAHNVSRAQALIQKSLKGADASLPDWRCSGCGEVLEGVFDTCWKCGMRKP
ncbi:hypothetical protein L861_21325 [Litchfieldella anticariensis FP35 = DSM 16096]|uniref:DUF2007 domain-containing protein n=1 Tax=Litchfieldella anticariensis (strain DSM 16096 / CECT 5854 / CIP 108499 / LMG 22089 / FP35) TaxID=1121939 RepID=S2KIH0_LITA3|nr:DUF2007 domain-containing protein [Halomonas anticariensis]EPC01770.1 hypothetical protein L861_21325 [Halomonas anticariensis FP35 = DSM 16096]